MPFGGLKEITIDMTKTIIIVPCYNEAFRLDKDAFLSFVEDHHDIDICMVDDGSSDSTWEMISKISSESHGRIIGEKLPHNMGKAEAVRYGFNKCLQSADYSYLGYFDADLSAPLKEVNHLLNRIQESGDLSLAFGSRIARLGSEIERYKYRHYIGRVIAAMINGLLRLQIHDTQCGAKLFNREAASFAFKDPFISRWLFDVEIFARFINKYGRARVKTHLREVPLETWIEKGNSSISWTYSFKIPVDLFRIWRKYRP